MFITHQFKSFDTNIEIGITLSKNSKKNPKKIFQTIEKNAKNFEKKFSRFIASSELNKINNKKTSKIKVSSEMLKLLTESKKFFKQTKHIFDPTILSSLNSIGYDKTFSKIQNQKNTQKINKTSNQKIKNNFKNRIPFNSLKINKNTSTIETPENFKIDLGGIAKGYWVDHAKNLLKKHSENFWLSAGGDIFIQGQYEKNIPWNIEIQNPLNLDQGILNLTMSKKGMGIATSSITKRKYSSKHTNWHHIIDPRTGLPVKNSILSVTVIAKTTTQADIIAKTILILGIKKGLAKINNIKDHESIIITKNSKFYISKGIKKFL